MIWKCPNCYTEYKIDKKYAKLLEPKKDCKFCVRKHPNIPTTAEMDGLISIEDMRNRLQLVFQCVSCKKWTLHLHWNGKHVPCSNCNAINYDPSSIKSYRTYNAVIDNKRKPKIKKK